VLLVLLSTGLDFAAFADLEAARAAALQFKESKPSSSLTLRAVKGATSLGTLLNGRARH
jgi:hypothetical protein